MGGRDRTVRELAGRSGVWPMEDTMGGADPLTGRLRWGGAAPKEPKSETETWAGPGGRASGRLGRVLPRAPPRWPLQPPPLRETPPPTRGPRVRAPETAEAEATKSQTVPGGWAQLPQGPGERPPRIPRPVRETPPGPRGHIPRRTPPREHALDRRLSRCRRLCRCRGCLLRRLSQSLRYPQQPPPTAAASRVHSGPRAPDPAHAAPPRATPRLQTSRRARTYLPRPLPEPGSLPALPPHVTPPERTAGACAGTPHSSAPGGPAQTFLPHLTAELGTLPQILTPLERNVARLG
ncbi:cleavage and polyadenylation specificity factor subunit 6-like [Felis catus]|uniref:cleavage and polyadenylation specificity factor subunit 6-like n=1 Tax=Felis catus TaxID=9685 RepID=UPI000C2FF314|nr:cleavage and polyadenylation specificity factor subunit 6-like [Felis catus]